MVAERICRIARFRVPICFLVDHPAVGEIIDEFTYNPQIGFVPAFVLSSNGGQSARGKVQVVHDESEAFAHIREDRIPIVVINGNGTHRELYEKLLEDRSSSVRFYSLARFYEFAMQKVPLDVITRGWLLENVRSDSGRLFEVYKRAMDIFISSLMLIVSLPLWPLIAIAIKLESKGPVLFRQDRLGKDRRIFTILKFRTMRLNGNNHAPTEKGDARVTAVGDFLRKTRLDEIPQAVNILKGDMSFVGPRPERPELAEQLAREVPFYYERNRVLPGITGWDQVCGEYHSPSSPDTYKKIQYDLYYIKNRSVQLELTIFLRTIRTILFREGR
jgi:exopolysaccharide biosynthesis polyprenyl glycosylphosphotransferase